MRTAAVVTLLLVLAGACAAARLSGAEKGLRRSLLAEDNGSKGKEAQADKSATSSARVVAIDDNKPDNELEVPRRPQASSTSSSSSEDDDSLKSKVRSNDKVKDIVSDNICQHLQVLRGRHCVDPEPVCEPPQVLRNHKCVDPEPMCEHPKVLRNNKCVDPEPVCEHPKVLRNNKCIDPEPVCEHPKVLHNNKCVDPEPVCEHPKVLRNNKCVDPEPECGNCGINGICIRGVCCVRGQELVGGKCVDPEPVCEHPKVLRNNKCVDPEPECGNCGINGICIRGVCCVRGQELVGGKCVDPEPECHPPKVLKNHKCVDPPTNTCPKGKIHYHGKCYNPPKPYDGCDKDEHDHCKPRYWYCGDRCHPRVVKCKRPGKVVVEFITIVEDKCYDLLDDWYEWLDDEGYCVLTIVDDAKCPCSDCWKPEHGVERCPCMDKVELPFGIVVEAVTKAKAVAIAAAGKH